MSNCHCCEGKRWICPQNHADPSAAYFPFEQSRNCITSRCPVCVDLQGAVTDWNIGKKYYMDERNPIMLNQYNCVRAAILEKYPDWTEEEPMYDRIVIPVVPLGSHCELCDDERWICPGCTGGRIPIRLFMGCGVDLRCPWCVDYQGAQRDREVMEKYYLQDDDCPELDRQYEEIDQAIRAKFPDEEDEEEEKVSETCKEASDVVFDALMTDEEFLSDIYFNR